MRQLWTSFSVPIMVSAIGLFLVLLLGVAPLVTRNAPAPKAAAPTPTAAPTVAASSDASAFEAMQRTLSQQAQALDSLSNQVRTLEKGITRLNTKLAAQSETTNGLAALGPDVARAQAEVAILNKAVPRINARLARQSDSVDMLPELSKKVAFIEAQMRILNAAVPRLQERIQSLRAQTTK